jgi:hypothetical protein
LAAALAFGILAFGTHPTGANAATITPPAAGTGVLLTAPAPNPAQYNFVAGQTIVSGQVNSNFYKSYNDMSSVITQLNSCSYVPGSALGAISGSNLIGVSVGGCTPGAGETVQLAFTGVGQTVNVGTLNATSAITGGSISGTSGSFGGAVTGSSYSGGPISGTSGTFSGAITGGGYSGGNINAGNVTGTSIVSGPTAAENQGAYSWGMNSSGFSTATLGAHSASVLDGVNAELLALATNPAGAIVAVFDHLGNMAVNGSIYTINGIFNGTKGGITFPYVYDATYNSGTSISHIEAATITMPNIAASSCSGFSGSFKLAYSGAGLINQTGNLTEPSNTNPADVIFSTPTTTGYSGYACNVGASTIFAPIVHVKFEGQ